MQVSGTAACDDAFLNGCLRSGNGILQTKLSFLHLGLGSSAYADNRNAACELRHTLLKLLLIKGRSRGLILRLDLSDTCVNGRLVAGTVNDRGGFLLNRNVLRFAEHLNLSVLKRQADFLGDYLAAGQDGDILQHFFSAVAVTRSLNGYNGKCATQLIKNQRRKGLTLNVLSDDHKLTSALYNFFKNRKNILNVADLLIGKKDQRIRKTGFHLVHIGCHVGGAISLIKLHTLNYLELGLHGLAFLDGDYAVIGNLLHGVRNQSADFLTAGGDGSNLCDMLFAGNRGAHALQRLNGSLGSLLHTLSKNDRVRACCQVLHAFVDHCLRKYGCGSGTVAGYVVRLGGNFLKKLCAHVLKCVRKLDLLGNRNTVVGDERCAVAFVENYVAALRSERYLYGIRKLVYTGLQCLSGIYIIFQFLSHNRKILSSLLFHKSNNIILLYNDELLIAELYVRSGVLRIDYLIAFLHEHGNFLAVNHSARADRDNDGFLRLLLRGCGKNNTGLGRLFGGFLFQNNFVT